MEEAIICFESVSAAIMAEQILVEGSFTVRVMPTPSSIRAGCGFCLRFLPEDLEQAAEFLAKKGISAGETYIKEKTDDHASYRKIP